MLPRSRRTRLLTIGAAAGLTLLAGCSSTGSSAGSTGHHGSGSSGMGDMSMSSTASGPTSSHPMSSSSSSSMPMHHGDSGPVPAGMKSAAHPKYPVGSTVTLTADHMPGMDGAKAKVVGAYSTFTYAVTYTPTTGGAKVTDHKWVVQQEIKNSGSKRLANGTHVVLAADHMPEMKGAKATVVSSTDQPVYVVDYTAGGMTMKNHKWVVQDEMKPASS